MAFSVTLSAFFWAFACWKATIPLVHPFSWDATLALLDATFHGGRPDALLAPVFGSPRALIALDGLYECWAYVMFLLVLWQAWQPNRERCARFFLAFGLTWIVLGILGATVFSSAGPCYANGPGGGRLYSELFARLHAADAVSPLMALKGQAYLWTAHVRGLVPQGSGISAFPSLHVATAVLAALAVSESSKALGALAWLYVGLVWVASVMLGWHYAVDGEAALLAVIVCWQMAGFLTSVLPHEDVPRVPAWRFQDTFADAHPARADTPGPVRSRSWTFWP